MNKGIAHLKDLQPGFASVFEVIYSLATEIHSWRAAVQTILQLYSEGAVSMALRIYTAKEATKAGVDGYQYSISVRLIKTDPMPCLDILAKYSQNLDTEDELSKYKEVDGTPICGIPELDTFAVSPDELNLICSGLNGVIMRSLLQGVLAEKEVAAQDSRRIIEQLRFQLGNNEDFNKILAPKSQAFAGRIILACARQLIGEKKSRRMSESQLTEALLEILASADGNRIASARGLLPYIRAGWAKESY